MKKYTKKIDKKYLNLIGKVYFNWEIEKILPNNELLCLKIKKEINDLYEMGTKKSFFVEEFIVEFFNSQPSKHKTLPKELFQFLK